MSHFLVIKAFCAKASPKIMPMKIKTATINDIDKMAEIVMKYRTFWC